MNSPRLQIIRGLPGSGKTTLAVKRYPHLLRLETDMYFTRGGKYTFTKQRNEEAVAWFQNTVFFTTLDKMDFVVTGVFAAHTERLANCVYTALDRGYEVYIKTLKTNYGNIHNVPKAHIDAMKADFVSDRQLKKRFGIFRRVHFGLMPSKLKV